jgi:hypothetical protein
MSSKDASEQAARLDRVTMAVKGGVSRGLACVLFPLVHLLLELPSLLLVHKGQAGEALLELKGVEKGAVLVVPPGVEYLLVPDDATTSRLHGDS